jgi:arylsulfatase A-like enzyme
MNQWNLGQLGYVGKREYSFPHTLPGELAKAGYHTQAVGKMHFYPQRKLHGFHHMTLDESSRREGYGFISDYHLWFEENKEGAYGYRDHSIDWNSWMARPAHLPEHLHPTHWTATEAIKFLQRRDPTKPFFLWLSFARPHSPYDPPQVYYDMYIHRDLPEPACGDWSAQHGVNSADPNAWRRRSKPEEIHRARAAYYGSVTFIDHQIGRVLYELQKMGLRDSTLILFTSDHGDMLGDHYLWRKTYAYESSARVPFLVAFPRGWNLPRGQVREEVVELRDIMPTLLEAAGAPVPETVYGSSLLPLLRGDNAIWREYLHGEHSWCYAAEQEMQYLTDGKEKYVWFPRTGEEQLFDLRSDPLETRNLAQDAACRERVTLWRERLIRELSQRGDRWTDGKSLHVLTDRPMHLGPNHQRWLVERAE